MAGELYNDPTGGLPPDAPDLASLQYPWSQPLVTPATLQPGIGIPVAALDAAVPPGPQPEGVPPIEAPPPPAPPPQGAPPAPLPPGGGWPGGPAQIILGPPPTVADLADVTTEPLPTQAEQLAGDPLRTTPGAAGSVGQLAPTPALSDEEAQAALARMSVTDPTGYAAYKAKWLATKDQEAATRALEAATANKLKAQANADRADHAYAFAASKQAELDADYKALANTKIDPSGGLGTGQKIAGALAAVIGGLVSGKTGRPNEGMAMLQRTIDAGVEAQKADIANRRSILGARQTAVGEMYARTGDMYRSAETARAAAWESTIQQLQAEQMKYDPRGTTAFKIADTIQAAEAQKAAVLHAYGKEQLKNALDVTKENREGAVAAATIGHLNAEAAKLYGGLGGGGAARVSGAAPKYTVDTGLTNPFDRTQPLFGIRQLGGKGEDPKERATVENAINSYAHAQDGWARLKEIGDRIQFHKSLGESVWGKWKDTDAAEYDAATHSLVVDLTKELGDKLTQGQIDEQGKRIPQRTSWLESRDVGKMIKDAQEEADQHLSRDLTLYGLPADQIIQSAREARATIRPTPQRRIDDAQAAVAANPSDRNATQELVDAQQDLAAHAATEQKRARSIDTLQAPGALPAPLPEDKSRSPAEVAEVQAANRALQKAKLLHAKFDQQSKVALPKTLKPGERAAADRDRQAALGDLASEAVDAQDFALRQREKAEALVEENGLRDRALQNFGVNDPGLEVSLERQRKEQGLDPITGEPVKAAAPQPEPQPEPEPPYAPEPVVLPGHNPFVRPVRPTMKPFPPAPARKTGKR